MKHLKIEQRPTDRSEKSVMSYFDSVAIQPAISPEEEKELLSRIQAGDQKAKDRLVCGNLRFVISIAKQYQNQGLSLSDLISEGNYGLIKAAEKFCGERDNKFISYAVWWIRDSIQKAIQDDGRTIRLPRRVHDLYRKIVDFQKHYEAENWESPSLEEIADGLDVSTDKVRAIIESESKERSLDTYLHEDGNQTFEDTLPQDFFESPEDNYADSDTCSLLHLTLESVLQKREQYILRQFFGLDGEHKSAQELGTELNLSRERIRQVINESFDKIRKSSLGRELRMCC